MGKILIADYEKCNGCTYCMLACSMAHENEVQRSKSRIKVYKLESEAIGIPMLCEHCTEPTCIPVCPVNAIGKDPKTGIVSIDVGVCTGCRLCVDACPYKAIMIYPEKNIAFTCDLCGGDPVCAKVCLPGAITWVDVVPSTVWRKKDRAEKRVKALKHVLEVW